MENDEMISWKSEKAFRTIMRRRRVSRRRSRRKRYISLAMKCSRTSHHTYRKCPCY